ncbi:MAG TPA: hypothetical protein VGJ62_05130 [Gemmatimonadaceae bacterium]|jgi:hypothetical protein
MKQLLSLALISLSLLIGLSSSARGQKTYALGFGGGAAIPVGKLSDTQKTGYNAIALLAIGVAELPLGVRFDAIYNNILNKNVITALPGGGSTSSSDLRVGGVLANLVFAFPGTNAKAYVITGGGLYSSKADVAGAKAQNNLGFNAGLGATFGFGPFATFLESRYHSISRSASKGGVYQFVPITFGLLF